MVVATLWFQSSDIDLLVWVYTWLDWEFWRSLVTAWVAQATGDTLTGREGSGLSSLTCVCSTRVLHWESLSSRGLAARIDIQKVQPWNGRGRCVGVQSDLGWPGCLMLTLVRAYPVLCAIRGYTTHGVIGHGCGFSCLSTRLIWHRLSGSFFRRL